MVLAWMTQAMEFALAGFVGCFLFWVLKVVPFNVAFSGFANETPWFLFAALLQGFPKLRNLGLESGRRKVVDLTADDLLAGQP